MSRAAPKVAWRPHDVEVPLQQGDLLVVAWAKTIEPQPTGERTRYPTIARRDAFSSRFWDANNPPILEMWGCLNYGLAVVIADDCAIDKEFNILRDLFVREGLDAGSASERANERAEPFVATAEVWPVDALPVHLQRDAESGAVGYVPFSLGEMIPEDQRTYVVDLNRISTISWRAIDRRLALRDERWRQRLQTQLCRFFAARTIRVNEQLADIFDGAIARAEALTPPTGSPPRTRARLYLADGRTVTVEAILSESDPAEEGSARPGLQTQN